MPIRYDIAYGTLLGLTAPIWGLRRSTRAKVADALRTRTGDVPARQGTNEAVLVHAVSVGELNAARGLIDELRRRRPGLHVVVTTTTTTGDARARELYGNDPDATVLRFPLDLSRSVGRMLDRLRPSLCVLLELEVWPNFMAECGRRGIPVALANGRVTEPSVRRYKLLGPLGRSMFAKLAWAGVQDQTYADRFATLGVPADKIAVTGTLKFDTAPVGDDVPGSAELARDMGIDPARPLWVAGSTGPGEEEILLGVYRSTLDRLDGWCPPLQLAIVPRKPERFDEVAALIESRGFACVRRSRTLRVDAPPAAEPQGSREKTLLPDGSPAALPREALPREDRPPVALIDTMGELRKAYALASVVFVGRSLVDLGPKQHGSDMIEPAALGKPTIVGPFTGNFEEPMRAFRAAKAILEVVEPGSIYDMLGEMFGEDGSVVETYAAMGRRAREVVAAGRGSAVRHVDRLLELLPR